MHLRRNLLKTARLVILIALVIGSIFYDPAFQGDTADPTTVSAQSGDAPQNPVFLPLISPPMRDDLISAESNLVVQSVSVGYAHGCAVRLDGTLICWGLNTYGQATPPPGTFEQVAAGANHTCAVDAAGALTCWGDNTYGQSSPPQGQYRQVTAGGYHSCAISTGGALSCWGWNSFGQLDGIPSGGFQQVAAGNLHTCAVRDNGALSCWGWNADGQTDAPAGAYSQVSAGGSHSCATAAGGRAVCWGSNLSGELNVPAGSYTAVGAGGFHSCGLTQSGEITCWGSNGFGQLDDIPQGAFSQISVGGQHTCAVRAAGSTLACWGWNRYGQSFPPSGVVISAGRGHACAVRVDGTLNCWGDNDFGQSDPPDGAFTRVSAANGYTCAVRTDGSLACWGRETQGRLAPPAGTFVDVSGGAEHACALDLNGSIHCWGDSASGKTSPPAGAHSLLHVGTNHACALRPDGGLSCWGNNSAGQTNAPAGNFTQISAGGEHTCARNILGQVACWGSNAYGQSTPLAGTFAQVSAGSRHTCGIRAEGPAACWGLNTSGEIDVPEGIFSSISAADGYTCAVRLDGTLSCWGNAPDTPEIVLSPDALPEAQVGKAYKVALSASGGMPPHTFRLVDGALPEGLTLTEDGVLQGKPAQEGTYTFTIQAADTSDPAFSGRRTYQLNVLPAPVDSTPPVIKYEITGKQGKNGWYVGPVSVTWSVSDPESPVTKTEGCEPVTLIKDTAGVTLTCRAVSQGGESSASVTIKIDQTPPTLDIRFEPEIIYLNGDAKAKPGAEDNLSGVADAACEALDTSTVGKKSVTCWAVDHAGNRAEKSVEYQVVYLFKGYFPPLVNPPAVNRARAGEVIPIKFQVLDANEEPITDLENITLYWKVIDCALLDAPESDIENQEPLDAALQETMPYKHLGDGYYVYYWFTKEHFAGTCKIASIDLGEGEDVTHPFLIKFKDPK